VNSVAIAGAEISTKTLIATKFRIRPDNRNAKKPEPVKGIEPSISAWQTCVSKKWQRFTATHNKTIRSSSYRGNRELLPAVTTNRANFAQQIIDLCGILQAGNVPIRFFLKLADR
jgi:hypothetical protein